MTDRLVVPKFPKGVLLLTFNQIHNLFFFFFLNLMSNICLARVVNKRLELKRWWVIVVKQDPPLCAQSA